MSSVELGNNIAQIQKVVRVGGGAQFWAYISPSNDTAKWVTEWSVTLQQVDGNWTGQITSADPQAILQTPDLSGIFNVTVVASGPNMAQQQLTPLSGYQAQVGCNSNCAAMIGIVADAGGASAHYWPVWDAICS